MWWGILGIVLLVASFGVDLFVWLAAHFFYEDWLLGKKMSDHLRYLDKRIWDLQQQFGRGCLSTEELESYKQGRQRMETLKRETRKQRYLAMTLSCLTATAAGIAQVWLVIKYFF